MWNCIEAAGKTSKYPPAGLPELKQLDLSSCNLKGRSQFVFCAFVKTDHLKRWSVPNDHLIFRSILRREHP